MNPPQTSQPPGAEPDGRPGGPDLRQDPCCPSWNLHTSELVSLWKHVASAVLGCGPRCCRSNELLGVVAVLATLGVAGCCFAFFFFYRLPASHLPTPAFPSRSFPPPPPPWDWPCPLCVPTSVRNRGLAQRTLPAHRSLSPVLDCKLLENKYPILFFSNIPSLVSDA